MLTMITLTVMLLVTGCGASSPPWLSRKCPRGTYDNFFSCRPCRRCEGEEVALITCSHTRDTVCIVPCPKGQYYERGAGCLACSQCRHLSACLQCSLDKTEARSIHEIMMDISLKLQTPTPKLRCGSGGECTVATPVEAGFSKLEVILYGVSGTLTFLVVVSFVVLFCRHKKLCTKEAMVLPHISSHLRRQRFLPPAANDYCKVPLGSSPPRSLTDVTITPIGNETHALVHVTRRGSDVEQGMRHSHPPHWI